jgi:hypothetical protein
MDSKEKVNRPFKTSRGSDLTFFLITGIIKEIETVEEALYVKM